MLEQSVSEMEANEKREIIKEAIKELMEEDESRNVQTFEAVDEVDDHRHKILSKLLSELEALEQDGILDHPEQSVGLGKQYSSEIGEKSDTKSQDEDVIKELKKVKKQNFITHCLLSALIVLTVAWQLSEVSLILKIKDGFSHPFKSIGSMLSGMLKQHPDINMQDSIKQATTTEKQIIQPTSLPGLKIPDLPRVDLPGFDQSDEED